jgi:putative oxidoreductase
MKLQLTTIGRILFALPFGLLGINHFIMKNFYLMMVTSVIPFMGFSVLLVGLILIIASISIILNKMVQISCWTLASLLLLFIIFIHIPNLFNEATQTIGLIELMKDTALLGGSLMIAGMSNKTNAA